MSNQYLHGTLRRADEIDMLNLQGMLLRTVQLIMAIIFRKYKYVVTPKLCVLKHPLITGWTVRHKLLLKAQKGKECGLPTLCQALDQ